MCIRMDIVLWADLHRIDMEQTKGCWGLAPERANGVRSGVLSSKLSQDRTASTAVLHWTMNSCDRVRTIRTRQFSFPTKCHRAITGARITERHGPTPRQVALNFLTRHPCTFAIPKTSRPEQIKKYLAKKSSLWKDLRPIYARWTEICSWKMLNDGIVF